MSNYELMLIAIITVLAFCIYDAHAANPNLFVSAENPQFENHFAGSMVIEVVIRDSNIANTGEGKGEPDVTLNGKILRMAQGSDGNWYAYFANVNKAKIADSTVKVAGTGLDFGVFCDRNTSSSVFGIDLSDTDGFAVPSSTGLLGFSNGNEKFSECHGTPEGHNNNNTVRKAKSLNVNTNVPTGQIGLDPNAWPLVQLFSFSDVTIRYNAGTGSQQVELKYDDIPNITTNIDRDIYPQNAQVILTINDIQLNQDPTDEDSWTFQVAPNAVFYDAFDNNVNLLPHLSNLGFEDNGILSINPGKILDFDYNLEQPQNFVEGDTGTFSQIVTLVESQANSGIFDTSDYKDKSIIVIKNDAPRGQAASITYNDKSMSVLTGSSLANISLGKPSLMVNGASALKPGTEFQVILDDKDQNLNSDLRDRLDVFRTTAIIPTIKIGEPVTLENAYNVRFFNDANSIMVSSSVPDVNSERLFINTSGLDGKFERISFNLGVDVVKLKAILAVPSQNNTGTNWLNYDLRSLERNLNVTDFTNATIELFFDSLDSESITLAEITSSQGFVQIKDDTVRKLAEKSGKVLIVINFEGYFSDIVEHPIILDFFSFGVRNDETFNNSIYRFELEETSSNSATFDGTVEYAIANQLNIFDPKFIQSTRTISDEIKFVIMDRLVNSEGIAISYSDLNDVGITTETSTKSSIRTNSGIIYLDADTYRFGQPVTITLEDPDLNLKNDTVEIYNVIDDTGAPNIDTVGSNGEKLLEIFIKDFRYKRCTINGEEYGGLAHSGFALVETTANSGIFKGIFKMPSKICNKSGTQLISTAGGSIDVKYYDYRDESGNQNITSLSKITSTIPLRLSADKVTVPFNGTKEIILSGHVTNHTRGEPLIITLIHPDDTKQEFASSVSSAGKYGVTFTITKDSLVGIYTIILLHDGQNVGTSFFTVSNYEIPAWVQDTSVQWLDMSASDYEFAKVIRYFIEKVPESSNVMIPDWIREIVSWWIGNQISDEEFLNSIQFLVKQGIIGT